MGHALLAIGLSAAGALSAMVTGCYDAQSTAPRESRECTACHGDDQRRGSELVQSAPPVDLDGETSTSAIGVGAHLNHLQGNGRHAPVACAECHIVPESTYSPGHVDSLPPADVVFGELANLRGHEASWDRTRRSCGDNYCHRDADPDWTAPRSGQEACGTCHGLPPPPPHPPRADCESCHGEVVSATGFVNPERHVNGVVDVGALACASCHGSGDDPKPPPDLAGNTDPENPGVGAHQAHGAGRTHGAVACGECHPVPDQIDDPLHLDDERPADVIFGALARAGDAEPSYDAQAHTCSNSYCHQEYTPVWTAPRESAAACGSCHGLPPPLPHPQVEDCSGCHSSVVDAGRDFIAPELHVNGTVDVSGAAVCSSCHGDGPLGAPPPDLDGEVSTSRPGVGAHAQHLEATNRHAAVACAECHVVPTSVDASGHIDGRPAEVTFGDIASAGGADPVYDSTNHTCANTYCHGSAAPTWTNPRASTCGSCHGLPPPPPHPPYSECHFCHAGITADFTFTAPERHVNGEIDVGAGCTGCHGESGLGAPPPDLSGSTEVTARGVGAHAAHLEPSETHGRVACSACHTVPASPSEPGHYDTELPAEISFGDIAGQGGAAPVYDPASQACTNTYCHGASSPDWRAPRSSAAACGSCHGLPPPLPHPPRDDCARCHEDIGVDRSFTIPSRHVDGVVDVDFSCNSCHGSEVSAAPPFDLTGDTARTSPGVGAHQAHLNGLGRARPLSCGECHVVPSAVDAPGHLDGWDGAEVVMSGVAAARGSVPTYDPSALTCQNTYCHGPGGANVRSPVWTTAGTSDCASCHGFPPPPPHTQTELDCSQCHGSVISSSYRIIAPALHVNGTVDF